MSGADGITQSQLQELEYLRKRVRELESEGFKSEKEKFESFAEASPFGLILISDDLTFEYVNPKFVEMFGYELSEIPTAHHWREKVYPDPAYREEVTTAWRLDLSRAASGAGRSRMFTVRCKDGTDKVIHFRPVKLKSGGNLMTCEDITAFRRIEDEMRLALSILESTLESTADGLLVVGADGKINAFNEKFLEIWGMTDREIVNKGRLALHEYSGSMIDDPEAFWDRVEYLREHSDVEAFDTIVLKNGRIIERYSIPQKIGGRAVGRVWSFRDVTEKKAAELSVIRAKEEWELTFDSVKDLMAIFDPDFRMMKMNLSMEKVTGVEEKNAIGRFCYDVTGCSEGSLENCPLYSSIQGQGYARAEHYDTGKKMALETRMSSIIDSDGVLRGYIHITRDITDRKELETELAEAIEDLKNTNLETRSMLDSARALLEKSDFVEAAQSILENATRLVGCETGFLSILNEDGSQQRILCLESGMTARRLEPCAGIPLTGPELLAFKERRTVYRNFTEVAADGSAWAHEGQDNPNNIIVSPLIIRNQTVGLLRMSNKPGGFTRKDVILAESFAEFASIGLMNQRTSQELERSEERYRMIFACSPMGIMHYDRNGVIIDCNERFVEIIGSSRDQLVGMEMLERLNNEEVLQAVRTSLTGETGYFEGDYLSVTGAKLTPVKAIFHAVKSEDGRFIGGICVLEDVSGVKAAEEALVQAERVKAVADLAAGVAHNFNNLLQIITGSMELAIMDMDNGKTDDARRSIEKIRDSARLGAETVRRLQTFARIRVDKRRNDARVFDISETILHATQVTTPLFKADPDNPKPQVRFSQKLQSGVLVHGRDDEIFEVIVNLIKNAAEACPEGGDVNIKLYSEGEKAVVEISDNGIGIAEYDIKKVFDPFWTPRKTNIGAGLGLPLSHGIVSSHGGSLTVTSKKGRGTTFIITLPLSPEGLTEDRAPEQTVMGLPMSVLVIDDMEPIVQMLGEVMNETGHKAFTATSGDQAIEIYKNNRIDVVVCDLVMPRMDGWQVGKAIKEICATEGIPKTPFVLLTGWGGQALEEYKIQDSGVDSLLEKPIDIKKLLDVMSRLVTGPVN
ncbi:MAG: PAS domain S-box protein [Pseudomonadota bacterium]